MKFGYRNESPDDSAFHCVRPLPSVGDAILFSNLRTMTRAYHFVSLQYGLDDLRRRRLKISRLGDLNDPFELWAIAQPDPRVRQALIATKRTLAQQCGLLCFSLDWHNPVLWSHYADRHRGIALGFDIDPQILKPVSYRRTRPTLQTLSMKPAHALLFTKYFDWNYEHEARVFTALNDRDPQSGLHFANFNDQLILRDVIAGSLCTATLQELREAVGSSAGVRFTKARLAFKTFRVVTNRRGFDR
jgi:hypothetical protein